MHLTLLSPTIFESAAILNYLEQHFSLEKGIYKKGNLEVALSICGVGLVNTCIHTMQLANNKSDLLILIGLAGAYNQDLDLGSVVNITEERYGDLGAEDKDGSLISIHDLELIPSSKYPFKNGKLINPAASEFSFLPSATSVSVNKVTGSQTSIDLMRAKFNVDVENMEGAAFYQVCMEQRKKFLQIRAISNYVEPRNRAAWQLDLALKNLSDVIISMLDGLSDT